MYRVKKRTSFPSTSIHKVQLVWHTLISLWLSRFQVETHFPSPGQSFWAFGQTSTTSRDLDRIEHRYLRHCRFDWHYAKLWQHKWASASCQTLLASLETRDPKREQQHRLQSTFDACSSNHDRRPKRQRVLSPRTYAPRQWRIGLEIWKHYTITNPEDGI